MKYFFTIILFLSIININQAQKISNINYDEIEKNIKDSTSLFFYPKLIKLFSKNNPITIEEYQHLYYGNVYYKNYSPMSANDFDNEFKILVNNKEYKKAIPIGKKSLLINPVNLKTLYKMLICYHNLEIKDSAKIYADKYYTFINVIMLSGDGKSTKTAFVVNCKPNKALFIVR
jgi:tetratricopeptide (TPR) repeat protein